MIILGIDPGLSGGLAFVDASPPHYTALEITDIPTVGVKAKRRVQVPVIIELIEKHKPAHAFIERAQALPRQGSSSGFNYGRAVGALEAIVQLMQVPLTLVEAASWKRYHGLIGREKEDSRQRAIMLFPGGAQAFSRKLDHNRAEAALIAIFGFAALSPTSTPPTQRRKPVRQLDLLDRSAERE